MPDGPEPAAALEKQRQLFTGAHGQAIVAGELPPGVSPPETVVTFIQGPKRCR